jgi:hypothetical protein
MVNRGYSADTGARLYLKIYIFFLNAGTCFVTDSKSATERDKQIGWGKKKYYNNNPWRNNPWGCGPTERPPPVSEASANFGG